MNAGGAPQGLGPIGRERLSEMPGDALDVVGVHRTWFGDEVGELRRPADPHLVELQRLAEQRPVSADERQRPVDWHVLVAKRSGQSVVLPADRLDELRTARPPM